MDQTTTTNNNTEICARQSKTCFDDPLLEDSDWVFEMIDLLPVWEDLGYFGRGVRVRINDHEVDNTHSELIHAYTADSSCPTSPSSPFIQDNDPFQNHGTATASIIAAQGNNDECSVGIASLASISMCPFPKNPFDDSYLDFRLDDFDISSNSWGRQVCSEIRDQQQQRPGGAAATRNAACPFRLNVQNSPCSVCQDTTTTAATACRAAILEYCSSLDDQTEERDPACLSVFDEIITMTTRATTKTSLQKDDFDDDFDDTEGLTCLFDTLGIEDRTQLERAITQGRDGKGIIFTWASGNAHELGEDANFQAYLISRFTISVGAVGRDGLKTEYSSGGSNLFLVAPALDSDDFFGLVPVANFGGGCISSGPGTSFSAPVVSGVVALMLEANPELTWRDVQQILATTSTRVLENSLGTINAAGIWHSNSYGFGIVNANKAVVAAQNWILVPPEKQQIGTFEPSNPVELQDGKRAVTSITIGGGDSGFMVESAHILLDLSSRARGHLQIILESPSGTRSQLTPGNRPENYQPTSSEQWHLASLAHFGEEAEGEWILEILDNVPGDVDDCLDGPWELVDTDGEVIDCSRLELYMFCGFGKKDPLGFREIDPDLYSYVFDEKHNDLLAGDVCCACGGSGESYRLQNQLNNWSLVIYGHETRADNADLSLSPTKFPTNFPTQNPTHTIEQSRTILPTLTPSMPESFPSLQPSVSEANEPVYSLPNNSADFSRAAALGNTMFISQQLLVLSLMIVHMLGMV